MLDNVIEAIESVEYITIESSIDTINSMLECYDKSMTIIDECDDSVDCMGFKIIQEADSSKKSSGGLLGSIKNIIAKFIQLITGKSNKAFNDKRLSNISDKSNKLSNETSKAKKEVVSNIVEGGQQIDYKKMKSVYNKAAFEQFMFGSLVKAGVKIGSKVVIGGVGVYILKKTGLLDIGVKGVKGAVGIAKKIGEVKENKEERKQKMEETVTNIKNKGKQILNNAKQTVDDISADPKQFEEKLKSNLPPKAQEVVEKVEDGVVHVTQSAIEACQKAADKVVDIKEPIKKIQNNVNTRKNNIIKSIMDTRNMFYKQFGGYDKITKNVICKIDLEKNELKISFNLTDLTRFNDRCKDFIKNAELFIGKTRNKKNELVNTNGSRDRYGEIAKADHKHNKNFLTKAFKQSSIDKIDEYKKSIKESCMNIFIKEDILSIDNYKTLIESYRSSLSEIVNPLKDIANEYKSRENVPEEYVDIENSIYRLLCFIFNMNNKFISIIDSILKYIEEVCKVDDQVSALFTSTKKDVHDENNNDDKGEINNEQ